MPDIRVPPYDPHVEVGLAKLAGTAGGALTPEAIPRMRAITTPEDLSDFGLEEEEFLVPGYGGALIEVTIFRQPGHSQPGPGVLNIHGGGMVAGDRRRGVSVALPWVLEHGAVVASVEYRLAPEYPDPYPVEDCYSTLIWLVENAESLGMDPAKVLLVGGSAGGGLAAGVSLLARDRRCPAIAGQLLLCPMLDDRDTTVSTRQFEDSGTWSAQSNRVAWGALLGELRGSDKVSIYAAPARATDLSNLPPTFIDCGSAEVFRDEDIEYASRIWRDGGIAELHVWPGGTHGWEMFMTGTIMAEQSTEARNAWVRRLLTSS